MAVSLTITSDLAMPLSQENLPQTVTLTAAGVDSNDGAASFNYSWHIIDKPEGSETTLSALVGTNVQLDIDTWGTYRVFCIATNLGTNESSEDNPYAAPLNSFFNVQIESTKYDLEKPAKSQRNWHPQYWHLVDTVENIRFDPATFIAGGSVEIATAVEIAQTFNRNDSTSGEHYLAVTTEELFNALHPTVNGNLGAGATNGLRDRHKEIALEQINESSITELKDVDTTTTTPSAGQALIWSPTHVDDTNGDVGAWIPGDVTGSSNLFGVGLCAGETLDGGDFLIYDANCLESEIAIQPGWHARNKTQQSLTNYLPKASPGATALWQTVGEAAGETWEDNICHPGQVAVADFYQVAKGWGYDQDQFSGTGVVAAAMAAGTLPSLALTADKFIGALTGIGVPGQNNYAFPAEGFGEENTLFYDGLYHTSTEIAAFSQAVTDGTYDAATANGFMQAFTGFVLSRLARTSITRLADVDTTTHTPVNNDLLVWDATATDDSGLNQTGAWVPKSASELSLGAGGGVDGLTSNSVDTITLDSGYTIVPQGDDAQDLGSTTQSFRNIYANEIRGDYSSTDSKYTHLKLDADIPSTPSTGLKAAALYSRGSIAMMIDTNNAGAGATNSFFVYEGGEDDSTSIERFSVDNTGNVKINGAYTLPTSDGSNNEVMITNGTGQLSFVDVDSIVSNTSSVVGTFDQALLGEFTDEIPYQNSGYTVGLGRSPMMFLFRNPYDVTINLKDFTFTCAHMHSSTINFSFVECTHAQMLNNTYTTISSQLVCTKTNIDPNTNNEGIGSLEGTLGVTLAAGNYVAVFMNGYEKTGQPNERFFINIEYTS